MKTMCMRGMVLGVTALLVSGWVSRMNAAEGKPSPTQVASPAGVGAAGGVGAARPGAPAGAKAPSTLYVAGGGRGSVVRLATFPEVQQDLALSAAQKEAVATAVARLKAFEAQLAYDLKHPPALPGGSESEQRWVTGKHEEAVQALSQARLEIGRALGPTQMRRLEQIGLQELGAEALFRSDVVRSMNITPAQQKAMAKIQEATASSAERAGNGPGNASGATSRPGLPPEAARRIVEEVLTAQQRTKWGELLGRPLQLRSPAPASPANAR